MAQNPILESFLANQGYALFEFAGDGDFRAMGRYPEWCEQVWGAPARASDANRLADHSPFLENFLVDAEDFWNRDTEKSLRSGNWIERTREGGEIPLEATAVKLAGKRILILRNLSATFAEQQQLYQTARDSLLEHERLIREIQKKEILLHCIIHDLSQPLGAMRGCFDLLASEKLAARVARFVEIARGESLRQEQMIRGILEAFSADLSAQQSAEAKVSEAPDLAACAKQAVQDASAAFEARGVRLQLDAQLDGSRDWKVAGDAPRILRIFGNLLENAQRYTPRGKGVTVGLEDKGGAVLAYVDDEGPGLPADKSGGASAGQLFALFAKGKDRPGKAGLGLYFCKITVERWGGTIGAENRPQGGSRFWFRLPRAAGQTSSSAAEKTLAAANREEDAVAERAARSRALLAGRASKPMHILVAEDNEANRELLIELLRKRGHTVTGVPDGREALAALKRQQYDILLVDEEMPRLNGIEATRAIRQEEASSGKHLVIIGVTGNATEEDEKRFLEAGMNGFLPKPVRMEKLFEVVESVGRAPAPAASVSSVAAQPEAPAEDVVEHLRRTTGGNEPLMRSLAKTFLADAPQQISTLRRALAKKDAAQVGKTAHLLKGALSIFGASRVVEAARSLEAMGRAGGLDGAAAAFSSLEGGFARLQQELQTLQPKPKHKSTSKSKFAPKLSARPHRKPKPAARPRRKR